MKNDGHRKTTELLALLVFGMFALCVAAVLLMGGKTYQTLTHRGGINGSRRTAVRYLTTRFQQASAVRVEDFCGFPTLSIPEEIDGYKEEISSLSTQLKVKESSYDKLSNESSKTISDLRKQVAKLEEELENKSNKGLFNRLR